MLMPPTSGSGGVKVESREIENGVIVDYDEAVM